MAADVESTRVDAHNIQVVIEEIESPDWFDWYCLENLFHMRGPQLDVFCSAVLAGRGPPTHRRRI